MTAAAAQEMHTVVVHSEPHDHAEDRYIVVTVRPLHMHDHVSNSASGHAEPVATQTRDGTLKPIHVPKHPPPLPYWKHFLNKCKGAAVFHKHPKRPPIMDLFVSFVASFIGIGLVAVLHFNIIVVQRMIIASFGASAVLIYGAISSPLAQPRNFMLGHLASAIVGLSLRALLTEGLTSYSSYFQGLLSGVAVGGAVVVMYCLHAVHPPGGATALITLWLKPDELPPGEGFWFLIFPILTSCTIMLIVAVIVNNIPRKRHYPQWWW